MDKKYENWTTAYINSISEETSKEVSEALSPKEMKKRLALIKKAVEKIDKKNTAQAKKDALKMMKDSGMFDEAVEETVDIEEGPLVMGDMDIVDTFFKKIKDDLSKLKIKKQDEKAWPLLQQLAKMAGYGITKKGQSKGRVFRYEIKK
mgnify:FL=1|tara:strand:+ start:396 stop:839 length:444 start_codon:yes stop_codon:yes gene_type:complete